MSVYNGEKYLNQAIESILNQTFTDFEFIIIDDSSSDKTPEILQRYKDPRIIIVRNNTNLGLTKSLNIGLNLAKGEYIARMDADDISYPERLEKQVKFLEKNENIGVLGTSRELIDDANTTIGQVLSISDVNIIKWSSLFGFHEIAHPTAMIRKNLMDRVAGYNPKYSYAQDAELWSRLSEITTFSNLPDILLKYRMNTRQISQKNADDQKSNNLNILRNILEKYSNKSIDINILKKFTNFQDICTEKDLRGVYEILQDIHLKFFLENNLNINEYCRIQKDLRGKYLALLHISYKISKIIFMQIMVDFWYINLQVSYFNARVFFQRKMIDISFREIP